MVKKKNHIDLLPLFAVLALMALSLGVVYSASSSYAQMKWGESGKLLGRHAVKVLIGFALLIAMTQVDYHRLRKYTKPALLTAVGLLAVTLVLGMVANGASRWLRVSGFGLQPSEFAKFALVAHLATLLAEKRDRLNDFATGYLPMLVWIGVVTVLVLLQPNFSTGGMLFAISLTMLFAGGSRLKHISLTVACLLPVLMLYMFSAPYRMQRILAYVHGGGAGVNKAVYQSAQGVIAFGNGGLFGVGPGESRQRDFFLPESYGDFVYSIVGEEYGLIGTLLVMSAFLIILLRGMKIAKHAPDDFGRQLALGITASITLYALVNACVTLGILPTTGLPMPFVSYGGTSMVITAGAVGVLLNISSQTNLHPRSVAGAGPRAGTQPLVASGRIS